MECLCNAASTEFENDSISAPRPVSRDFSEILSVLLQVSPAICKKGGEGRSELEGPAVPVLVHEPASQLAGRVEHRPPPAVQEDAGVEVSTVGTRLPAGVSARHEEDV